MCRITKCLGVAVFAVVSMFGLAANGQVYTNTILSVFEGSTNTAPVVGSIGGVNVSNWLAVTVAPTLPGTSATGLTNYVYVAPSALVTNALDSFQYQVVLSSGVTNTVLQPISVIEVNNPPTGPASGTNTYTVAESTAAGQTRAINLATGVSDQEDSWWGIPALTYVVVNTNNITDGTLNFAGGAATTATFIPTVHTYNVTNTFVYTVTDSGGLSTTLTGRIIINPAAENTTVSNNNAVLFIEKQAGITNGALTLIVDDPDVPHPVGQAQQVYNASNFSFAITSATYGNGWYAQVSGSGDVSFTVTATNQVVNQWITVLVTQTNGLTSGSTFSASVQLYYGPKAAPALVDYLPKVGSTNIWEGESLPLSVTVLDSITNSTGGSWTNLISYGLSKVEWYVWDGASRVLKQTDTSPVITNGTSMQLSSSFSFGPMYYDLTGVSSNYTVYALSYDVYGNYRSNGWSVTVNSVDYQVVAVPSVINVTVGSTFTVPATANTTNTVFEWNETRSGVYVQLPGGVTTYFSTNSTPVLKALKGVESSFTCLRVRVKAGGKYASDSPWMYVPVNIQVPINAQAVTILSNGTSGVVAGNTLTITPSKANYDVGDQVTCVASPSAGYVFVRWGTIPTDGGWSGVDGLSGELGSYIVQRGHDGANLKVVAVFKSVSSLMKPVVVNPGPQVAYVNNAISLTPIVVSDSGNLTYTLSATGLPPGMKISGTGIVGTPIRTGVYDVALIATNPKGASDPATFKWTVSELPGWITKPIVWPADPQNSFFNARTSVGLSVTDNANGLGSVLPGYRLIATGLPPGMSISGTSIFGAPLSTGVFKVVVLATNLVGASDPMSFTWTVAPLPSWIPGTYVGWVNDDLLDGLKLAAPQPSTYTVKTEDGTGTITIDAKGRLTGKFCLNGYTFPISASCLEDWGTPDNFGIVLADQNAIPAGHTLTLSLYAPQVGGVYNEVTEPAGIYDAVSGSYVKLSHFDVDTAITGWDGYYTLSLMAGRDFGSGYLAMTVKNGNAKVAGKLADGTAVAFDAKLFKQYDGVQNRVYAMLYTAPVKYRSGTFCGLVEFTTNASGAKVVKLTRDITQDGTMTWVNNDPMSTGVFFGGFDRMVTMQGGIFSSLAPITNYYVSGVVIPGLDCNKSVIDIGDSGKKVTQLVGTSALGAQLADGTWVSPNGMAVTQSGTAFSTAKADAPGKNKDGSINYANDSTKDGVTNVTAFAIGLVYKGTAVTGMFRGNFNAFFDYVAVDDLTTDKQSMSHVAKRVRVEGIMVPNRMNPAYVEGAGFFLWPRKAIISESGQSPFFTYLFNESYDFDLVTSAP